MVLLLYICVFNTARSAEPGMRSAQNEPEWTNPNLSTESARDASLWSLGDVTPPGRSVGAPRNLSDHATLLCNDGIASSNRVLSTKLASDRALLSSAGRGAPALDHACFILSEHTGARKHGTRKVSCLLRQRREAADLPGPLRELLLRDTGCSLADHRPADPGPFRQPQPAAQALRSEYSGGTTPPAKSGALKAVRGEQGVRIVAEQCGCSNRCRPTVAKSAPAWIFVECPLVIYNLPKFQELGGFVEFLPHR
jgi:hypothetical protein